MKIASSVLFGFISLMLSICLSPKSASAETVDKVLMIIKEIHGSAELQFLENNEVFLMKHSLEEAGFLVEIASASGRTFLKGNLTLESDFKLSEVVIGDYNGFMITCSALGVNTSLDRKQVPAFGEAYSKPEEVAIAKQIVDSGKPVAAQDRAVIILAEAGVLEGKKYSYKHELQIGNAIYGGQGIVRDGNIITYAYCPYWGSLDQTVELTKTLIDLLQQ